MFVSEISLWGAAIVACVVIVAMVALAFSDNQMLQGGVPAFDGLLVTLLLVAASFVANILAGVVALGFIKHK
jgi:hypothetical protein